MTQRVTPSWFLLLFGILLATHCDAASRVLQDVLLIPGNFPKDSQPDGNTILIQGDKNIVVIDTGRHPEHTRKIIEFATLNRRRVDIVINTHWHLDHVGGNRLLRESYPHMKIYASDAIDEARSGFLQDYRLQLRDLLAQPKSGSDTEALRAEAALIDGIDRLVPDIVVDRDRTLVLDGRTFSLHLEKAATHGDVWIEDARSRALIAGDLVTLPVPFFDTACPTQWENALRRIESRSFKVLIPGHGPPLSQKEFSRYRRAFSTLIECSKTDRSVESCSQEWRDRLAKLIGDDTDRVAPMIDYYFKTLLRTKTPNRHCR